MEEVMKSSSAEIEIWKYVFGFAPMAVVKCAIELRIADVLETHGGTMTLPDLSAALGCSPPNLRRIMRYLIHRGIFKAHSSSSSPTLTYAQTPLSRMLIQQGGEDSSSMAPFVLMTSNPEVLSAWHSLSARALAAPSEKPEPYGGDFWRHTASNPALARLFNDAMASRVRLTMPAIIKNYPTAFEGVTSLVDVGGGDGTALRALVTAFPWIRGINFDLPHVVAAAPLSDDSIVHVPGDMFVRVPNADVAFLMWVLHDWSDDECIQILTECREAVISETTAGKVMIAEAVIDEEGEDKYSSICLDLDMVMLAHMEKGKERTYKEWEHVIMAAGFTSFTVKHVQTVVSIIEAYP